MGCILASRNVLVSYLIQKKRQLNNICSLVLREII